MWFSGKYHNLSRLRRHYLQLPIFIWLNWGVMVEGSFFLFYLACSNHSVFVNPLFGC